MVLFFWQIMSLIFYAIGIDMIDKNETKQNKTKQKSYIFLTGLCADSSH